MFENDKDLDIALELETGFDVQLNRLVHQTDMLASDECLVYYKTEEYAEILKKYIEEARAKLDGGMGDDLFKKYRNVDDHRGMFTDTNYLVVVLGALMMRAGAKIKPDDFEYLRTILPNIPSRNGFTLPWFDDCFRDPGKVQFAAALEHYKEGIPRDFGAPRYGEPRIMTVSSANRQPTAASNVVRSKQIWMRTTNYNDVVAAKWPTTAIRSARRPIGMTTRRSAVILTKYNQVT